MFGGKIPNLTNIFPNRLVKTHQLENNLPGNSAGDLQKGWLMSDPENGWLK